MKAIAKILALAAALFAATATTSASDIDSLAIALAAGNPALAELKAGYDAEIASASAANALAGPELEGEYKWAPVGETNRWGFGISQGFDWPGVYAARRKAASLRAGAFTNLYRAELAEKALEAKTVLIDLAVARRRLEILSETAANVERMAEIYQKAYEQGNVTVLDVRKFSLQRFSLANSMAQAQAAVEAAVAAVNGLCPCVDGADLNPTLPAAVAPLPRESYESAWKTADPSLAAANTLHAAALADVSVARRSALPSFRIGYVHDYEERMHFNGISLSIELPSWAPRRAVAAAQAGVEAASSALDSHELRTAAAIRSAHASATALYSRLSGPGSEIASTDYPELLQVALDRGVINIFTFFEEYNQWLDARLELTDITGEYAKAMALLDKYSVLP